MKYQSSSHNCSARLLIWLAACSLFCQPMQLLAAPASLKASAARYARKNFARADLSHQRENFGNLPLSFEANRGQAGAQVKFIARQREFTLALTPTSVMLGPVKMQFAGANAAPRLSGLNPLLGKNHYFLGNDQRLWHTDMPTYSKVEYKNLYPGIDLLFYGNQRQLEYDFIVAPGADPKTIKLNFHGAKSLRLDDCGDLILKTQTGELRQRKPFVYQEAGGVKREVASRFVLYGQTVKFALGAYDATKTLVIDPVLGYSTLLGGALLDAPEAITVDAQGNVYVTGSTTYQDLQGAGAEFPTTAGAVKSNAASNGAPADEGTYVFVSKLNPSGTALIYSAIIGGTRGVSLSPTESHLENRGLDIAVDPSGAVYVTGLTQSVNFPTTPGALQTRSVARSGINEAFVFRLNPTGAALDYSTLLGQGNAIGQAIAVNQAGEAWVTGYLSQRPAPNFRTTPNAWQPETRGATTTGFVAKLSVTADRLLYGSFLSSGSTESGTSIALDSAGAAYVTGWTSSSCVQPGSPAVQPFLTTDGAFQRDAGTGCASGGVTSYAFVTKFTADGEIVYSTLIPGAFGNAIAVDAAGSAYIGGKRLGALPFPVTSGAFQTQPPTTQFALSGFVTKLNPAGSNADYSTYFSGSVGSYGNLKLAVDSQGRACLTGSVSDSTFVATTQESPFGASQGAFVTRFNAAGSALDYSVVMGDRYSGGRGIGVDSAGSVYVAGATSAPAFPVTPGVFQEQRAGSYDAFILKMPTMPSVASVSAASFTGMSLANNSIVAAFGQSMASSIASAASTPLPVALAGSSVKIKDATGAEHIAPLFFVSPNQINYLVPAGVASGAATITVIKDSVAVSTGNALIALVAPGLFTANSDGRGVPAALALYVKADGSQRYTSAARYDDLSKSFVAAPIEVCADGEQAYLILFGTGLRHRSSLAAVGVKVADLDALVSYAGEQGGFAGLDQINVQLPRGLCGRGEVEVVMTVDGKPSNAVKIFIK
ncbi:MAG: SBBP repeat-containing protein [Acidobacteriota bacterium]